MRASYGKGPGPVASAARGHTAARRRPEGQVENSKDNQLFIWPVRVYYEDTDAGGVVDLVGAPEGDADIYVSRMCLTD